MIDQNLTVRGHRCRDKEEFEACNRDLKKIEELEKTLNRSSFASVEKVYGKLISGAVTFESRIGWDFDDEINELYLSLSERKGKGGSGKTASSKGKAGNKIALEDFDEDMQKEILREMKKRERRRVLILILTAVAACVFIGVFVLNYSMNIKNERLKKQLKDTKKEALFKPVTVSSDSKKDKEKEEEPVSEAPLSMLTKYEDIYNLNNDLIGWIKIADTVIDYPVMQGEDNDFYLTHDFYGNYDRNGCIFLDASCCIYPRSSNLILYGHHMKSGKMFAAIEKYAKESFYKKHPYILFDSLYDEGIYEVMYVFRDRVYSQADVNFKYYEFYDATTEEEFNSYMKEMEERSFYDTGVRANYGDALLTLSTCDYEQKNGRFVVVARRVYEDIRQ